MIKKILGSIAFLIIVIALYVFYIFNSTGFFRDIENSFDGRIVKRISISGPEDLQISYEDDFILISSDDRAIRKSGNWKQGHLYYIDLKDTLFEPVKLTEHLDMLFFPHGISMVRTAPNVYKVFVINHPKNTHTLEVFDLVGDSLVHEKTLHNPSMVSPNDIVAIDKDRFYFTNDHGYTKGLGRWGEEYLGWSVSNVIYFDGNEFREVAEGIAYANGINFDKERNLLFVASPRDFLIKVYRQKANGNLSFIENIPCGTGVDNIEIAPEGKIWVGCHPNLLAFTAYASGAEKYSPSEIIEIDYRSEGDYSVDVVYVDNGKNVSASTVAGVYEDYIFIGNVMDDHLLVLKRD